jgi:hypothetical protein
VRKPLTACPAAKLSSEIWPPPCASALGRELKSREREISIVITDEGCLAFMMTPVVRKTYSTDNSVDRVVIIHLALFIEKLSADVVWVQLRW